MNLADVIDRVAAHGPDKVALRFEGAETSYSAFAARIDRAARALHADYGIGPGDRVAILAHNHPDTLVLIYACARLGAMLVPLNWRLAAPELAYILADAAPKLLVLEECFAHLVDGEALVSRIGLDHQPADGATMEAALVRASDGPVARGDLSAPLLLVYTSGTTGRPKGAVLPQEALVWNGAMSQHMHAMTAEDHVLAVLPFFHVGGLNIQTTPALHHGATVTIHRRFAPDMALRAIAGDRPTLTVLVPATLQAVISDPSFATADLSSLRAVATGSTYVPQPLIDAFERCGVPVLQVYGSTETCPIAIYTRLGGERSRRGSTGWPGPFCEAKLVDEGGDEVPPGTSGEVAVRGPQVFDRYWRNEAASRAALIDGWFRTGDIATRDPDGAFHVHDRRKNMIVSGGENIYAAEIERVLLTHDAVAEAAVIGRPDPRWGEAPVAYVILKPGFACTANLLIAHVLAELARFKAPREFVFVEALPKSALGKVQHHLLREGSR